nr:hypothetical protein [Rhizobium sp. ACO-34A]
MMLQSCIQISPEATAFADANRAFCPGLLENNRDLEHFQQKCVTVLHPEMRKNKEIENFRHLEKSGNSPGRLPDHSIFARALLAAAVRVQCSISSLLQNS